MMKPDDATNAPAPEPPPGRLAMSSRSAAFEDWWHRYEQSGSLAPVQLGMTREDLQRFFGEPDATAAGSRRQPLSGIWKFGQIEFHFSSDGRLYLIYTEDEDLVPKVIASSLTS